MKLTWMVVSPLALIVLSQTQAMAQPAAFTNKSQFETATEGLIAQEENFDDYNNGQQVTSLFDGRVQSDNPPPTVFFGGWNAYGTGGDFSGGALIPEPRFQGRSLAFIFDSPVFGFGANAFDDFDGTPFVNTITLVVTTTTGETLAVSEEFPSVGDTGFLGAISPDGITHAEFFIDNANGNLEVDLLRIVAMPPSGVCGDSDAGQTSTLINFDDVQTLADYGSLGVTFSNASIWHGGSTPSVLVDVNGGAYSAPNALCIGPCGGEPGDIYFDFEVDQVSIWALSGPGSDHINPGTTMEAFDADGQSLGTRIARSDLQYDQLVISTPGIRRVRLYSPLASHEGWDDLEFRRADADPVCSAALMEAQAELAQAQASIAQLNEVLEQTNSLLETKSEELAAANASLDEGRLALQEIARLIATPAGQRHSTVTSSGALAPEINTVIATLIGPPGKTK
jgi:hypothetical protein